VVSEARNDPVAGNLLSSEHHRKAREATLPARILFIHPMGTDMYNQWTLEVLGPAAAPATELGVRHLPGLPETPFVPDTDLWRDEFFEAVVAAEKDGFDVVATACTSDPLVREAKHMVGIPVTGPFEALSHTAPAMGPLTIIASGYKIDTWAPRAAAHGFAPGMVNVRMADFSHPDPETAERLFATDVGKLRDIVMAEMERALIEDGIEQARRAVVEDGAASVFFACSLWSGMLGRVAEQVPALAVLDPLVMPLKYAEYLAAVRLPVN